MMDDRQNQEDLRDTAELPAIQWLVARCFHAAADFGHHLRGEIAEPARVDGDLFTVLDNTTIPYWVRNIWLKPFIAEFDSISAAARLLRGMQRNWAAYPARLVRRTALISQSLPRLPDKPKTFPFELPAAPMGAFMLLDEHTMLASAHCSSPWPNGELMFVEDRTGPPSRAYRKLWEALLMAGTMPGPGDRCIDAGASPGGWTWALAGLGASVTAIDRAPLDASIAALPNVTFIKHNAFTLRPEDLGPTDWLFSDVICYPPVLYEWVERWLAAGLARNIICTIKMQGADWDRATTERFAAMPGSKVLHLWHNRHELTWLFSTA